MSTPADPSSLPAVPSSPSETVALPPTEPSSSEAVTLPPSPAAETSPLAENLDGVTVPGYEVLGLLGRGGMGVVYKARQVQADRLVALKMILHAEHASDEERAVARLQHPHIVQVYEVAEHNGLPFFSLEFCAGGGPNRLSLVRPAEVVTHLPVAVRVIRLTADERGWRSRYEVTSS